METQNGIYKNLGYENRTDYLENLADEHNIPHNVVEMFAEMLGECEDFDGLVSILQDCC